jgi:hypothetical protein
MYRYRGYFAFKVMAELHQQLFPLEKSIDGNSRKANAIYRAFDKVYTDGIEDCFQESDEEISKMRKRAGGQERDI